MPQATSDVMPKYRCFKEVWALKIEKVERLVPETGTVTLTFEDKSVDPLMIDTDNRPQPEAGWYFVRYEDGYYSFSPARAFEEGYMMVELIPTEPGDLTGKISRAINIHSRENGSNTPDFILAGFLVDCLRTFDASVKAREKWYGRTLDGQATPSSTI